MTTTPEPTPSTNAHTSNSLTTAQVLAELQAADQADRSRYSCLSGIFNLCSSERRANRIQALQDAAALLEAGGEVATVLADGDTQAAPALALKTAAAKTQDITEVAGDLQETLAQRAERIRQALQEAENAETDKSCLKGFCSKERRLARREVLHGAMSLLSASAKVADIVKPGSGDGLADAANKGSQIVGILVELAADDAANQATSKPKAKAKPAG